MGISHVPVIPPLAEDRLPPYSQASYRDFLPRFIPGEPLAVYCANGVLGLASSYVQSYVIIGKTGYLIDEGQCIGYRPSTWQGQLNLSLLNQDFESILQRATRRSQLCLPGQPSPYGLWSKPWSIGGTHVAWVQQFKALAERFLNID